MGFTYKKVVPAKEDVYKPSEKKLGLQQTSF